MFWLSQFELYSTMVPLKGETTANFEIWFGPPRQSAKTVQTCITVIPVKGEATANFQIEFLASRKNSWGPYSWGGNPPVSGMGSATMQMAPLPCKTFRTAMQGPKCWTKTSGLDFEKFFESLGPNSFEVLGLKLSNALGTEGTMFGTYVSAETFSPF